MKIQGTTIWMPAVVAPRAACGGGNHPDPATGRGALLQNPPRRTLNASAPELRAQLSTTPAGRELLALVGAPVCGCTGPPHARGAQGQRPA